MSKYTYGLVVRAVLPPLLGAFGALAATAMPAYHAAFCGV